GLCNHLRFDAAQERTPSWGCCANSSSIGRSRPRDLIFPKYFVFIAGKPIRLRDILGGMEAHHHVDIGLNELAIAQIVQIVGRVHRRLVLLLENFTYPIKFTRRWRGGAEVRY